MAVRSTLHGGRPPGGHNRGRAAGFLSWGNARGRDGGHFWLQQTLDQNAIARAYTKWDHRLEYQDNPGLIVSRALQVARSEPSGPVYLSFPREIALMRHNGAKFPSADELGIARPSAPDPGGVKELALRLAAARNPCVVVSRSGREPATVPALVDLCETLGMPVIEGRQQNLSIFSVQSLSVSGFGDDYGRRSHFGN